MAELKLIKSSVNLVIGVDGLVYTATMEKPMVLLLLIDHVILTTQRLGGSEIDTTTGYSTLRLPTINHFI